MNAPLWHWGSLDTVRDPGARPLAWYIRLDDPSIGALVRRAALSSEDRADLAPRAQAGMRAMRRCLSKALLARVANLHPDDVRIIRRASGALEVASPLGWHLSVAGQWPHCLIGIARSSIGVDIEPANAPAPLDDMFTDFERSQLSSGQARDRIMRWVAKEAHAKRVGQAAQLDPTAIETMVRGPHLIASSSGDYSLCFRCDYEGLLIGVALVLPPNAEQVSIPTIS